MCHSPNTKKTSEKISKKCAHRNVEAYKMKVYKMQAYTMQA